MFACMHINALYFELTNAVCKLIRQSIDDCEKKSIAFYLQEMRLRIVFAQFLQFGWLTLIQVRNLCRHYHISRNA